MNKRNGNLTSAVQSELSESNISRIKNLSLPDEYIFKNGGRDFLSAQSR